MKRVHNSLPCLCGGCSVSTTKGGSAVARAISIDRRLAGRDRRGHLITRFWLFLTMFKLSLPRRCVLHNIRIKLGLAPPGRCVLHK